MNKTATMYFQRGSRRINHNVKVALLLILFLLFSCSACGGRGDKSTTAVVNRGRTILTWNAPTRTVDGKDLTGLAGYKIYYGKSSRNYNEKIMLPLSATRCTKIKRVTECTYTIEGLSSGVYFFALTAYDTYGNESNYSNEASKTID